MKESKGLRFYLVRKYVYCQYYAEKGDSIEERRLQLSINLPVDKDLFPDKLPKHQKTILQRLELRVSEYEANKKQSGLQTDKSEVEALILYAIGKKQIQHKPKDIFIDLYDRYVSKVKSGEILRKGKKYSPRWLSGSETARNAFKDLPIAQMPASLITKEVIAQTDGLMSKKTVNNRGIAQNSVATYMAFVTKVLNDTRELGWHKGQEMNLRGAKSSSEDVDYGVYWTVEEQKAIQKLRLKGHEAEWRDAVIFGCQVCMRYSDLKRLTPKHRTGDMLNINTQKTGTPVFVPLNSVAKKIWDKYHGQLNVPSYYNFRMFIKKLGKDSGQTQLTLISRTEGGKKVERWVEKWELLGTHICRRSGSTNMYKAGLPAISIMAITGHSTAENFMKYIRLSQGDHATLIAEHPFFR